MTTGSANCRECGDSNPTRNTYHCVSCGGVVCTSCFARGFILCSHCTVTGTGDVPVRATFASKRGDYQTFGWSRIRRNGASSTDMERTRPMRRGAWYPVLNANTATRAVVRVNKTIRVFPSRVLEFRRHRPARFSVVVCDPRQEFEAKGSESDLGSMYAVCPDGSHRVRLAGHPTDVMCDVCGRAGRIAWDSCC